MTDQPAPPSEKKPRRRSAPRKRKPARKAEAPQTQATVNPAAEAAESTPSPVALGEQADAVTAGGATTEAAAEPPPAQASIPLEAPVDEPPPPVGNQGQAPANGGDSQPAEAAHPTATVTAEAAPAEPRARETQPRAAKGSPKPPRPPEATPQPTTLTQPGLRPGELIRVPLSVRWRDLDAFNHVNNSKYLSYLEEARLRWMLTIPGMGLDDHIAPVVAASTLNYRRPIGWPGEVVVELFVERVGSSSLTIGHRIVAVDDGSLYCDGSVVLVWIDQNSGRAAPLPDSVRTACATR